MDKERRKAIRFRLVHELAFIGDKPEQMLNITPGGVFIKTNTLRKPQEVIDLDFVLPGDLGKIKVPGKVVHVTWTAKADGAIGYGVEFLPVSDGVKRILEAFVIYLRNRQIILVSKRIVEEFFGNGPTRPIS